MLDQKLELDGGRYLRQTIFSPIGTAGQARLLAAHVLIVGCGATGTVIANTLARAGVGHLTIADRDFPELNNLQRQVLYDEADVASGLPKAVAAVNRLATVNSGITLTPVVADVNAENIETLLEGVHLVMDGTDNFDTRFVVNDACVKRNVPWIYTGAVASSGMSMTIRPHESACFRCVFPQPIAPGALPTCDTAGVIAPIVNVMASISCGEALKLLVQDTRLDPPGRTRSNPPHPGALNDGLISVDLWDNSFETYHIARRPDCPTCGRADYEFLNGNLQGMATAYLCGKNAVQIRPGHPAQLRLPELAARLRELGRVTVNDYLCKFATGNYELTIFPDARAIVQGTEDANLAKSLYSRYIGM